MKILEERTGLETWVCGYCDKTVQVSTQTPNGKGPRCGPHWDDTGRRVYYKMTRLTHTMLSKEMDR